MVNGELQWVLPTLSIRPPWVFPIQRKTTVDMPHPQRKTTGSQDVWDCHIVELLWYLLYRLTFASSLL